MREDSGRRGAAWLPLHPRSPLAFSCDPLPIRNPVTTGVPSGPSW